MGLKLSMRAQPSTELSLEGRPGDRRGLWQGMEAIGQPRIEIEGDGVVADGPDRLHALPKSTPVSWAALKGQFGAGCARMDNFKPTFLATENSRGILPARKGRHR